MSFDFDFTQEKLAECLHKNPDVTELYEVLCELLPKYAITTRDRVAAFLAQCGHESADFTILKENLNYSGDSLKKVWPRHFGDDIDINAYHRNPEAIANRAYRDRMGNGDEASGDGWKFRGRGAIQLTGRNNYTAFANDVGMDVESVVEYLETLKGAVESACWFWHKNGLNALADERDNTKMTKKINGGTIGLEDRKQHLIHCLNIVYDNV
jgi:putative chitinase